MILLGAAIASLSLLHGSALQFDVQFFAVAAAGTLASGVVYGRALAGVFDGNGGKALGICLGVGGDRCDTSPPFAHWLIEHFAGGRVRRFRTGATVVAFPVVYFFLRGAPWPPARTGPIGRSRSD